MTTSQSLCSPHPEVCAGGVIPICPLYAWFPSLRIPYRRCPLQKYVGLRITFIRKNSVRTP